MIGYSGQVLRSDYLIDEHKSKKSAMEFLKQLAYESCEDIFIIGKAEIIGDYIGLTDVETYKYSRKEKDWVRL